MNIVIYVEKKAVASSIAMALNAGEFKVIENLCKQQLGMLGYWEFDWKGNNTSIIYGVGHLAGLCDAKDYGNEFEKWDSPAYPCIPQTVKTKPKNSPKHYALAKEKFSQADLIISATDPDREGEVVFDNIYRTIGVQVPWKRVWLPSDLTKQKIIKAFDNLEEPSAHYSLRLAGKTRAYADWLVGINLTVAATNMFGGNKEVMNVGRVQTTVLSMVVNRTNEIENFVAKPFWKVCAECNIHGKSFVARLSSEQAFENKADAEKIVNSCQSGVGTVSNVNKTKRNVKKPLLYNTTNLQSAVNSKYGYSVDDIAKAMESLYNNHYISYPRTELCVVTTAMIPECKSIIKKLYRCSQYTELYVDDKNWESFTDRHFNDKAFLKSTDAHTAIIPTLVIPDFSKLSEIERNIYDLVAKSLLRLPMQDAFIEDTKATITIDKYDFTAMGSTLLNGNTCWYKIDGKKVDNSLPMLKPGDRVKCDVSIYEGITKPPSYFTDGSLLKAMQHANKIINDEELSDFMLQNNCGLGTGGTRAGIITLLKLHNLLKNDKSHIIPTDKGYWLISHLPKDLKMLTDAETTAKWEQMLYKIAMADRQNANGMACSFINSIKKATIQYFETIKKQPKDLFSQADSSKSGQLKCPLCGNSMRKFSWGYGCSNYKEGCKFAIGKFRNKKLTDKQITDLLTKGKTNKITFKAKNGNSYQGYLFLNNDKNIEFAFANNTKNNTKKE